MDLLDLLIWFLKATDWLALIVAAALGYLAGTVVPAGWWSVFLSMFVAYHLFLGWLVFTAKRKMELVRPLTYPATIHLACLVVITSLGSARFVVPHFDLVCCGVAVLAFFERNWLFQTVTSTDPPSTNLR